MAAPATPSQIGQELGDALVNVAVLANHQQLKDQPIIEAAAVSLDYDASFDTNFVDRDAFVRGISKYVEEAAAFEQLNLVLEEGIEHCGTLYTWRCCSRAVPQPKSNEQQNRQEMYEETLRVLGPEADKIKVLYGYASKSIGMFVNEVRSLSNPERLKGFISQTTKVTLGRMIDMFVTLDSLKNFKSSLNNDFAFWKRAEGFLNQGAAATKDPNSLMEIQQIGIWLATQRSIITSLSNELVKIDGFEMVLAEIVNECAKLIENGFFVLPSEKHSLLKTMAFGLYLMDINPDAKKSLYKNKAISISRFDKIFKTVPVVPLFGDMQITLMSLLQQGKHYSESHWSGWSPAEEEKVGAREFNILAKLNAFKDERDQLICALRLAAGSDVEGKPVNQSGEKISDLALRGLQTVARWTTTFSELYAWKLAHPMDRYRNRECTDDSLAYEKSCRYNYSSEEKTALIELIAMIKDVSRTLWQMQSTLTEAIHRDMHDEMQGFVQVSIREAIRYASKKKKQKARTVLLGLRSTCADWLAGREPTDPAVSGTKDPKYVTQAVPTRPTGPSSTQLYMFRTMLESLCADEKKKSLRDDLESSSVKVMLEFYERSYFYKDLLNYNHCLQRASDLSQLWYREYHLELTMGTMIQFPIEMSLPFMLVDHILSSRDPSMIEYVLYPLDLYNDAAGYALTTFRKQHLYDEVEAEVDLAFDQFIARLSNEIFTHYKTRASSIMLSSKFKTECAVKGHRIEEMSEHRYMTVLAQTSFQLLGRSVDISRLLTQRLNVMLRKAIDIAIKRFEGKDLTQVKAFEDLIANNRLTHKLLSEELRLDDFDEMYAEINRSTKQPILNRVTLTVFAELCTDLIPNFAFNGGSQRFVRPERAPLFGDGIPQRERIPASKSMYLFGNKTMDKTFAAIHSRSNGFVGRMHFDAIIRLLGYGSIAFCIDEMLRVVDHAIKNVVAPYVEVLLEGMPKMSKLPLMDYGSKGCIGFYQLSLTSILQYQQLQTDMFHAFREIGNGLIIFMMLEESLTNEEVLDLSQARPFQGIVPVAFKENEDAKAKIREAEQAVRFMKFADQLKTVEDPVRQALGGYASELTHKRVCTGFSIFTAVLKRIRDCLLEATTERGRKVFNTPPPVNDIMDVDECNQFHRLWSAILYVSASTCARSRSDSHQTYFGDGLLWGGCAIIALTNQQKRFQAFDFNSHIIRVWEFDRCNEDSADMNVPQFVAFARKKKDLMEQVFTIFDKYLDFPEFSPRPEYIPPPNPDADAETSV
eukprot:m.107332 g.107332  ORF g.107332 m.107332 type:complete len:1266 (-) comp12746_c0_seq1:41-3838(-)